MERSIFEDSQVLDDLICSYCDTFEPQVDPDPDRGVSWDDDYDGSRNATSSNGCSGWRLN